MYQHVILKDVASGEGLATSATNIRAFVGVGTLVLHPRCIIGEATAAVLACKGSLAGVFPHVAF